MPLISSHDPWKQKPCGFLISNNWKKPVAWNGLILKNKISLKGMFFQFGSVEVELEVNFVHGHRFLFCINVFCGKRITWNFIHVCYMFKINNKDDSNMISLLLTFSRFPFVILVFLNWLFEDVTFWLRR